MLFPKPHAQAGLEYLMTYGWALVLIVTVAAVLFFVFSPTASTARFSSSDPTKILLRAGNVSGTNAEIQLQNATGGKIQITAITPTNYSNCTVNGSASSISVGSGSIMKLNCTAPSDNKGSIKLEYTDFAGMQRSVTINASGTGTSSGGTSELGLVAYYKFDEGSGTTTTDSSGNGNNGTLLPASSEPTWQTTGCPSGNCLSFDGANDYVNLGTPSSLTGMTYPLTISAWVKPTTLAQNSIIVSLDVTSSASDIAFGIYNTNNQILVGNTGYQYGLNGVSTYLTAGTWQYWVIVFAGTTNITFYLDGVQKTLSNITNYYTAIKLNIGARSNGIERPFNGSIDEVKIYNRALSASEVCSICKEHIPSGGACNCT